MYTKESTCGGFLENGDEFLVSDKRGENVNRVFATNAYDIHRTANCVDLRSNWNNTYQVKVSTTTAKEGACSNQYLGAVADVDCERQRKRYRQNSRYVQIPNYDALPTRCSNEHAQLAKRRRLQEETAGPSNTGQMFDAKRRKFIGNMDVTERRPIPISAETKFEVFSNVTPSPLHKMEPWKRFSEAGDVWNSIGSEGDRIRGRFFRPVQPALHLKPSSEACPEEKEAPVRTSSRVNLTGSRLAKENVAALHYMPVARLSQQPTSDITVNPEYFKTESNRKFVSDEYSSLLNDTSPFTTTLCLDSSVQPYQRNFFDKMKSDNVYHLRDSISSSLPSAEPPGAIVVSTGGATFQKDFPRVEIPDPRLAFRVQSDSWRKRGSTEDEKTWSAGMPLHHNEDLRIASWPATGQERIQTSPKFSVLPSNMEEIKENVLADSMPCYRNRYSSANRSGYRESQISKGEELTGCEWRKTLEKPWQQGIPEPSVGRIEHQSAEYVFGTVLARGPTKYSHLERSPHTDNKYVVSKASRDQFIGSDVYGRDAAIRRREMSKNNYRRDNIFAETMSCSRRWTSPDYANRTFQHVRHVYARQTLPRAKSLSPSLMSNVGSGNFGSLESIRAYYRTMGRLAKSSSSSSSNSKGVSSNSSQYPETGTNVPIDLSWRVQKREHCDIVQNEPKDNPPSEMSNTRCSAHASTPGKQTPSADSPNTGSSVDLENCRKRYALSTSLPNSRISSPSPDSHLPPKKRRYLSYEWVDTSESKAAGEGNDAGLWVEDDMVKSTGHASIVDDVNLSRCCSNNRQFCAT